MVPSNQQRAFELQELAFRLDAAAAGIADELAVGAGDAVARQEDRQRVAAAGNTDGARLDIKRAADFAVRARLAIRDRGHRRPDALLVLGPFRHQRQIEIATLALEIGEELA